MICITISMKFTNTPLKRIPVEIVLDGIKKRLGPIPTDRSGKACFDVSASSGRVFVEGVERFQGRLDQQIEIELRNLTEMGNNSEGAASGRASGSTAYPNMATRTVLVNGNEILTDSEGYLVDPGDWSEAFTNQLAKLENLALQQRHWEVIRFQRDWFARHGTQASVRDIIKYFRSLWNCEKDCNHYLHQLFPRGGPQKQGNRLAGLLRTKGEH